ncbi:MAG TPA: ferrous iron transport protein B [Eubacteriales bacterium]|nr:ferrous iron transport protein B [Eubacteriales bacterium]
MKTDKKNITKTIALAGNPNSGKTTLFNLLTGSNQHIGNWAGVTVERKEGRLTYDQSVRVVDLPGIYSLSPLSVDEQVAYKYLTEEKPDLIINIVDATNLERNLFLTTQLLELGCDMVVALNMKDELESQGKKIDVEKLTEFYGVKFFSISASKNSGIDELIKYGLSKNISKPKPLKINKTSRDEIAAERYTAISKTVCAVLTDIHAKITKSEKDKNLSVSDKIDKIVTNKWLAFPIFAVIMTLIFYVSIDGLGGFLSDLLNEHFFPWLSDATRNAMSGLPFWLSSLVVDGIMRGVLSVVGFVPQIMLLFGFISVLEASGYMARVAFIMDRLFNKIGLNGKSFVAIIIGCGCSVPAIMSARTIKNINERNSTITLAPLMPCSAKLALFSFFTTAVFGGNGIVAVSLYFVSIICIIIGGLLLKIFNRKKVDVGDTFIMELPVYRVPQAKNVLREMWEKGKAFIVKAGTVIFVASVILWFLQSFDFRLIMVTSDKSILAAIGRLIAPLFAPLGWGEWQFAVATLTGLAAKETVVSTLQILYGGAQISTVISPLAAYSFLTFNLLAAPCIAAISTSFKEQGKAKYGWFSIVFQISLAYIVSLAIYQIGRLATDYSANFWTFVITAAIIALLYISVRFLAKKKGCNYECHHCPKSDTCRKKR